MPKVVFIGDIHKQIELCIFFGRGVRRGNRLVINLLYLEGGKCFLDVRLLCTKIQPIFQTGKMFNKNISK